MLDEALAVVLVEVGDDLGIAVGGERVAPCLEVRAELDVVVDLPVLRDPDRSVLVRERLASSLQVDDREAPRADARVLIGVNVLIVRPAMREGLEHAPDEVVIVGGEATRGGEPGDSTHA